MSTDVADFILDRLRQWNVTHIFGYPGDGINGLVSALGRADGDPYFVQTRHEEMADDLNQVTWELRAMGGAPKVEESQSLPAVSYAAVARSMGLDSMTVSAEAEVATAWDWALFSPGPTLLDVRCDPEVPPIPPHVTVDQILSLTQAIAKGDANARRLGYQTVKSKAVELLTHS